MSRTRRQQAEDVRVAAAELAAGRYHPDHKSNFDEEKFEGEKRYLASFTKGLPHRVSDGLIDDPADFEQFVKAIDSGYPQDIIDTALGPNGNAQSPVWSWPETPATTKVRGWESQGAGHTFDLEGPDAQSVTMPPAPKLGSHELTAEIAEIYAQALLRDTPFIAMMNDALAADAGTSQQDKQSVSTQIGKLNQLAWFAGAPIDDSSPEAMARRTKRINLSTQTAFRGITKGDDAGPYLSQFLLAGSKGLGGIHDPADGFIQYGSIRIDQRVRVAPPGKDYMEHWLEWLDVQNGADLRGHDSYLAKTAAQTSGGYRFISTPRDLATYVHYDALYQAYLNACLLLLANGIKFDPGIPFQVPDYLDHQQGFAHFGGPHILSLVTEVATRALKAVRYQKFNVHRRMRPEVLAGRLQKYQALNSFAPELETMYNRLQDAGIYDAAGNLAGRSNRLLPMAFPEGSPMHPSYGAGHATVAGACVTILKAFFDHTAKLDLSGHGANKAFVPDPYTHGTTLQKITLSEELTVEGELNKLAANIAIGRDWAGVHYFTDYIESIRLGEKIALGILEEQKLTYNENFSMTVPLFDGGFRTI